MPQTQDQPSNKFLNIQGEVVQRIHNLEQKSKTGNPYNIHYLVIKWTSSGSTGEFVDYIKIKVLAGKKMADIRAGYIVNVPVMYSCKIRTEDVEVRARNVNGVSVREPNLWPEFVLVKNSEITIINSDNNYESNQEENKSFENKIVTPLTGEDDLPF